MVHQFLLFALFNYLLESREIYPSDCLVRSEFRGSSDVGRKEDFFAAEGKKCRKVVETLPASRYAKALNLSVAEAYRTHQIPLFREPFPESLGDRVGFLLPGSRSEILEEREKHFKVRSSIDGSVGWLTRADVHRTLWADPKSGQACR